MHVVLLMESDGNRGVGLLRQRAPRGLAHIACGRGQSLLDASIAGYCGPYTTSPDLRRVDDELAVRRNARRFVECALGQQLHQTGREIMQCNVATIARAP